MVTRGNVSDLWASDGGARWELFRTLKIVEIYLKDYSNFEEAKHNKDWCTEKIYNRKRLHSSLGDLPTVKSEALYAQGP